MDKIRITFVVFGFAIFVISAIEEARANYSWEREDSAFGLAIGVVLTLIGVVL